MDDQATVKSLHKKMAPPLVTLLSAESEIQYVALRNINLIVQKNPGILAHEVKVSYCIPVFSCCNISAFFVVQSYSVSLPVTSADVPATAGKTSSAMTNVKQAFV